MGFPLYSNEFNVLCKNSQCLGFPPNFHQISHKQTKEILQNQTSQHGSPPWIDNLLITCLIMLMDADISIEKVAKVVGSHWSLFESRKVMYLCLRNMLRASVEQYWRTTFVQFWNRIRYKSIGFRSGQIIYF